LALAVFFFESENGFVTAAISDLREVAGILDGSCDALCGTSAIDERL
jgi:hypothetical protein